jgi:hypothetical protein
MSDIQGHDLHTERRETLLRRLGVAHPGVDLGGSAFEKFLDEPQSDTPISSGD